MSTVKVQGSATGTANFTITTPSGTSTDRTFTLPDSTGTIATAESTLAQFNASGSAPVYACRAWVNFDGTGTPAIRASGNVSSIGDDGTGLYTVNFTTAMPDANYSVTTGAGEDSDGGGNRGLGIRTAETTYVRVRGWSAGVSAVDLAECCVSVFR